MEHRMQGKLVMTKTSMMMMDVAPLAKYSPTIYVMGSLLFVHPSVMMGFFSL
jgi:hypothetical protein